jgi:hypothetical protein
VARKLVSDVGASQPSAVELYAADLMERAEFARKDPSAFYEFCIRHEKNQSRLTAVPHIRAIYSFVLDHNYCVLRLPVGTGKTFTMGALTIWLLGTDPTCRGAFFAASQSMSIKLLKFVKAYIENDFLSAAVRVTFPNLEPAVSKDGKKYVKWTEDKIEIKRPGAIRDPSVVALGAGSNFQGSRLSWILADDLLNMENCYTSEARKKTIGEFEGLIESRLEPEDGRCVVCNTPWHREDLTFYLEDQKGWPTLTMDIYGFVTINNASAYWMKNELNRHFRPSLKQPGKYRLIAFDPDIEETHVLFTERYSPASVKKLRYGLNGKVGISPDKFAKMYLCKPLSDAARRCLPAWVEKCKALGETMTTRYEGANPVYTGVDLAVGSTRKHDKTVFFTVEALPDGRKKLLDVESGHFTAPQIVNKINEKSNVYNSIIRVESNNAQKFIVQMASDQINGLRIQEHTTTAVNKHHADFGVESIFNEIQNGMWVIPCSETGECSQDVQDWIDQMLNYQPPPAHTGDHLMASWFASEGIRRGNRPVFSSWHGSEQRVSAQFSGSKPGSSIGF